MTLQTSLLLFNSFMGFVLIIAAIYIYRIIKINNTQSVVIPKLDSLSVFNERLEKSIKDESSRLIEQNQVQNKALREELNTTVRGFGDSIGTRFDNTSTHLNDRLTQFSADQANNFKTFREEVSVNLSRVGSDLKEDSKELSETLTKNLNNVTTELKTITVRNEDRMESIRKTIEERLDVLRVENSKKLDEMRQTVDEKLQGTLDKRLGESFKLVSERLDQVHKGLGEMQNLAIGVGDLKRVLTNVKSRGGWAEVQLGALLEQMLSPEQYIANARIQENSQQFVEYAVRIPVSGEGDEILLPIDAKFPHEDYERLTDAMERANVAEIEERKTQLIKSIKNEAKRIFEKYVHPPKTTDYAIMYLPTEGLYAEIIREPGLVSELQQKFRVAITGPTTLAATLNSLQMGFRSLAIQQRSSEVWKVLGETKSEFNKFTGIIDKVKGHIHKASSSLDQVGTRTRAIERKLQGVESIDNASSKLDYDLVNSLAAGEDSESSL